MIHPTCTARPALQRGLTLVELLTVLVVTALLLGAAIPSFQRALERRELDALAAQLHTDFHHARSLSQSLKQSVRVSYAHGDGGSCWVVHTGPAAECQCLPAAPGGSDPGPAACANGAIAHRTFWLPPGHRVQVQANVRSMLIDAERSTVTPTGTVKLVSAGSGTVHQVINLMGRMRSCSPGGEVPGYKRC